MAGEFPRSFLITFVIFALVLSPMLPCDAARLIGHSGKPLQFGSNLYVLLVYVARIHHQATVAAVALLLLDLNTPKWDLPDPEITEF
ncbi:hypothetical protein QQP08_019789 [Theobroma cacao]|nr:hypothetical protein QQP08_019789 [Theobroma cacao]